MKTIRRNLERSVTSKNVSIQITQTFAKSMVLEMAPPLHTGEIAEEANLPLQQAYDVRAAARASASLDQPVAEQEDALLGDFVAGDDPLPEEKADVSLRKQALSQALAMLPDRDRQVLALRYGLGGVEAKTLDDVGLRLGLSRERIRQIERDSLRRLATLPEMQAAAE